MRVVHHTEAIEIANSNNFILNELLLQIKKDLQIDVDWISDSNSMSVSIVAASLRSYLVSFLKEPDANIQQVLYRIDVDEHGLIQMMDKGVFDSIEELLTDLIIERELKKVIIRNVISGRLNL